MDKAKVLVVLLVLLFIAGIGYGSFKFKRWIHYKWSYADQVENTVCEMVESEALKEPERC